MLLWGRWVAWDVRVARMGAALALSMLVHALLFYGLFHAFWSGHKIRPGERAALRGRIIYLPRPEQPRVKQAVRVVEKAPQPEVQPELAVERPQDVPQLPPTAAEPAAPAPKPPQSGGDVGLRYGVSVKETLFERPVRNQVGGAINRDDYKRASDLDERAQPVELVVPDLTTGVFANFAQSRYFGVVTVALFINESGEVDDLVAVFGTEAIGEYMPQIADALRQSTFIPGKKDGSPVKSVVFETVRFGDQSPEDLEPQTPPQTDPPAERPAEP